jgi:ethanolamine utilization cobalamin adenosyltransferase
LRKNIEKSEDMAAFPLSGGETAYVDAETGKAYAKKPEFMTQLRGNLLVSKAHGRIAFRGAVDSLEAAVLEVQALAAEQGEGEVRDGLGELLQCLRKLMSAEVNERPLGPLCLFGLSAGEIRAQTHDLQAAFGMVHPLPDYTMGTLALRLNTLRTKVRETELLAVRTFDVRDREARNDIIAALNRLSSAAYWLFCRYLSRKAPTERP